jgi:nucleotide-binding universal stress UspA family protein
MRVNYRIAPRSRRCDLIVMGAHGRGAMRSALLRGQTLKILSHSKIPVLACR